MSSSSSPCAACKFLRRKCPQECVFAPYFPPDQPQRFVNVHKVFGASNVAKILNELPPNQREDAVNSLAYEAEARLRDPVYGCVGLISILQQTLKQIRMDLDNAKNELAALGGLAAGVMQHHMIHQDPFIHTQFHPNSIGAPAVSTAGPSNNPNLMHYNMALAAQMMGIPGSGGGGPVQGPGGHGAGGLMIGENKLQPQQVELGVVGARGQLMMRDQQQQQHPGGGGVQLLMREPNNMLQQQHHQNSQSQSHITDQPSQQVMEEQQLAAAMQVKEEQELMRNLEQQQQQHGHHHLHYQSQHQHQHQQYLRFSGDFDNSRGPSMASAGHGLPGPSAVDQGDGEGSGGGSGAGGGRFGKMNSPTTVFDHMSPSLALGSGYNSTSSTTFQINHQHLHHNQHHHHQQEQQHQQQEQQQHQLAPLMLLQALEPHHHTQQQQSSDVEASQIIPQQFFQEQPGRSGGASQDDGRHSSSSSVGTSFREDFQKVNL